MGNLTLFLIAMIGVLHFWFMILESFLWTSSLGMKTFKMGPDKAKITKALAQNQGVYNGFLAAGLFWGAYSGDLKLNIFFLSCVVVAGVVGSLTVSRKIFFIQSFPAIVSLFLLYMQ